MILTNIIRYPFAFYGKLFLNTADEYRFAVHNNIFSDNVIVLVFVGVLVI